MSSFLELRDPSSRRVVVIEDDGRVGYAYLLDSAERITSDVWLYNRETITLDASWENPDDQPFPNKAAFMKPDLLRIDASSMVQATWDTLGIDVYVDGLYTARLEAGVCPGWSRLATIDSPVAQCLDTLVASRDALTAEPREPRRRPGS